MSGKQASAAATLEGSPVEVGRALLSESLTGWVDGATGSIGSTGSGIPLFTRPRPVSKLCSADDFVYAKRGEGDTVRVSEILRRKSCVRVFTLTTFGMDSIPPADNPSIFAGSREIG